MSNDDEDDDASAQPPPLPSQPPSASRSRGLGCFLKGCLTVLTVLMFLGVGLGAFGWFFFRSGEPYISEQPAKIRQAEPTDAQFQGLLDRLQPFMQAMEEGRAATVDLSADDLNALIAREDQCAPLRGRVFLDIAQGQLVADLSFPATGAASGPNQRFINAHVRADASFASGKLTFALRHIAPLQGEAGEGMLPTMLRNPTMLQTYSDMLNRDFNASVREQSREDPALASLLTKLRTVVIEGDHLVLTTVERQEPTPVPAPSPTVGETPD